MMKILTSLGMFGMLVGFALSPTKANAGMINCNGNCEYFDSKGHPTGIKIVNVSLTGDGCIQDEDATVQFSPDGDMIELSFGGFNASVPPRQTGVKNCQIKLNLDVPPAYQVSLFNVQYDGFAMLGRGAVMDLTRSYKISGKVTSSRVLKSSRVIGQTVWTPEVGLEALQLNWNASDDLIVGSNSYWGACGEDVFLTVNARMVVNNKSNLDAYSSVDSATIRKNTLMHYGFSVRDMNCGR